MVDIRARTRETSSTPVLWLCMINPSGCGTELAHCERLPIKTNGAHVVGANDLPIGDSVALEVGAGRVAPNRLGPARVDALEPPRFTDRAERGRWVVDAVVSDRGVRQGPAAFVNPERRGEGVAVEVTTSPRPRPEGALRRARTGPQAPIRCRGHRSRRSCPSRGSADR
jgi:hypothetical protein